MADIKFSCSGCGQVLEAPPEMVGELVECPSCQHQFSIPAEQKEDSTQPGVLTSGAMTDAMTEALAAEEQAAGANSCTDCGAAMEPDAVLCLSCGFHKKLGKKISTDFG